MLAEEADRVVCLEVPPRLFGVGMWYRDFTPVSDEQVVALLAEASSGRDRSRGTPRSRRGPRERAWPLCRRGAVPGEVSRGLAAGTSHR